MMTEDQIERVVERRIDAIDKRYLAGELTEEDYREKIREVDEWAKRQSAAAPFRRHPRTRTESDIQLP